MSIYEHNLMRASGISVVGRSSVRERERGSREHREVFLTPFYGVYFKCVEELSLSCRTPRRTQFRTLFVHGNVFVERYMYFFLLLHTDVLKYTYFGFIVVLKPFDHYFFEDVRIWFWIG